MGAAPKLSRARLLPVENFAVPRNRRTRHDQFLIKAAAIAHLLCNKARLVHGSLLAVLVLAVIDNI